MFKREEIHIEEFQMSKVDFDTPVDCLIFHIWFILWFWLIEYDT